MIRSTLPDLLRATAVMAMIANHLAVRAAAGELDHGAWRLLFELGSFAPVLFFFTTGFGYGLQAEQKHAVSWRARLQDTVNNRCSPKSVAR